MRKFGSTKLPIDKLPLEKSVPGYVIHTKRTTRFEFQQPEPIFSSKYPTHWSSIRSTISVPIISGDRAHGSLNLSFKEIGDLKEEKHIGRAQLLAALLAYEKLHLQKGSRAPTLLSISLGKALRQARTELGLTQEQLSQRSGTSRIALSRWETGSKDWWDVVEK